MPQPADNPTGRTPMTRAEAARHASLVRWKKEQRLAPQTGGMSNPAIAARVKQILAEKANKGKKKKAGGKGKAAKPKVDKAKEAAANRASTAAAIRVEHADALSAFAHGGDIDPEKGAALFKQGLVTTNDDGSYRMSPAGKQFLSAAEKGDKGAARDAVAAGKDALGREEDKEQQRQERERSKAEKGAAREKAKADRATATAARTAARAQAKAERQKAKEKRLREKRKAHKAMEIALWAIKDQSDEERAMFAKMGGGRGAGRGYDKKKSTLRPQNSTGDRPKKTRSAAGGSSGSSSTRSKPKAKVTGDVEGYQKWRAQRAEHNAARRATRAEVQRNKARIDAIMKEANSRRTSLSRLKELQAELATLRAGKAFDMADFEIKAGARHSKTDQQHVQGVHDSAVALGAMCGTGEGDEDAATAIKAMTDDPGWYAQHECSDVYSACNALSNLAMLIQSELSEEDEDQQDIEQLVSAAQILVKFIASELDELEQLAADDAEEDSSTIGHEGMPMKAINHAALKLIAAWRDEGDPEEQRATWNMLAEALPDTFKAIAARNDVNPKAGLSEYGDVQFADAKNKKYPIDTEAHVRSAWNYINKEDNAAKYDPAEVKQIKTRIVSAWKKLIDEAGPPSAGKAVGDEDLSWLHIDGGAIKAFDDDTICGLAILYGTKATHDLERDYYDKDTDLWLNHWGWPRPITYHHGIDKATRDDPVVGHWTKATVTDEGVWLEGQLDRAHRYYKAVKELARRGYLKISSDSGPQWVIREPQTNGANYIKRWPLVTASVTVTPMEPRMLPVEVKAFLAELGLDAIEDNLEAQEDNEARPDAVKASETERARRLQLELSLLALETAQ